MKNYLPAATLLFLLTAAFYGEAAFADSPATPDMQQDMQLPSTQPNADADTSKQDAVEAPAKSASAKPWHAHSLDKDLRQCLKYDSNAEIRACVAKNG